MVLHEQHLEVAQPSMDCGCQGGLGGTIGTDLYNLDLGTTSGGRECDVSVSRSRENNV